MSKESFIKSPEDLPPLRDDVRFGQLTDEAIAVLATDRIAVVKLFEDREAAAIRRNVRAILTAHAPIRAIRKLIDKTIGQPESLPAFLRRKPLQIPIDSTSIFSVPTNKAIGQLEGLNASLYNHKPLSDVYGTAPHPLTNALLNRTPRGKWFAQHQDSQGVRGFGFAVQTAETLWHAQPSLTISGSEDFTFRTHPGDVVIIRERVGDIDPDQPLPIGQGFDTFVPDGSVVHTGLNLSDTVGRYTLNLFSTEFNES